MLLRRGGMAMADVYQENMQGCVQICSCVCGSSEHQPALLWIVQELCGKSLLRQIFCLQNYICGTNKEWKKGIFMPARLNNKRYFAYSLCCRASPVNAAVINHDERQLQSTEWAAVQSHDCTSNTMCAMAQSHLSTCVTTLWHIVRASDPLSFSTKKRLDFRFQFTKQVSHLHAKLEFQSRCWKGWRPV